MRTDELQLLRKMVKDGESRKLSAADFTLLLRLRFALQEYDTTATQQPTPNSKPSKG
jgi:hypothetical protein